MSRIIVLDDNMINMIAAGEVIERPGSVAKELLENSIDAGATRIVLNVEDGGRKLISIVDNGCGMDGEDLVKAFLPHATSKIRNRDDLFNIKTMGFRGEALASIAQVAHVTVVSRTGDSIEANRIEVDCGEKQDVRPCSGDRGTSIEVRNLFYKLPARRKFLRTANTEMTHITEFFSRIALSHLRLDLTLIHNGRQLHHLTGDESLRDRIRALLGKTVSEDLIEAESEEKDIKVRVLMGRPSVARGNNKYQYVFLNNRHIKDRFISHAMKEAYRGLIEPNKHPVVFLFIEMDPGEFDVNVHPTKTEVRFVSGNMVHSQVLSVMREKLLSMNLDVGAVLGGRPILPVGNTGDNNEDRRGRVEDAMKSFFDKQSAGGSQGNFEFPRSKRDRNFFNTPTSGGSSTSMQQAGNTARAYKTEPFNASGNAVEETKDFFLQIHNSYIITETEEGFVVIDQHALHERIIYEKLCRKMSEGRLASQRMLIPETFEVSAQQAEAIESNGKLIEKLGIEITPFGPNTMAIQAFPAILGKVDIATFVADMLDKMSDKTLAPDAEGLVHEILDMAACKAAIKAGQALTYEEMRQLVADKETVERSSRCPHGRPTTIVFSMGELEKQFKRTGF
ncbi:MAG: DNA mismatch repair endonuclease MutL [Planctomycetes bacterium]|nr:DNA mismatch repair endonuclease MutL [Planctomycetota bacterium]